MARGANAAFFLSRPQTSIVTGGAEARSPKCKRGSQSGKKKESLAVPACVRQRPLLTVRHKQKGCSWPAGLQKLISQLGKSNSASKSPEHGVGYVLAAKEISFWRVIIPNQHQLHFIFKFLCFFCFFFDGVLGGGVI